jgi:hypothetical protein
MFRKTFVPLAVLILAMAWTFTGPAEAQLRPSSVVLLPYFEVDLGGSGKTTTLAVGNALGQATDILIEVRTNWGIPVAKIPSRLEAHEVKTFNLRDWFANGKLPHQTLRQAEKVALKAALSGLPAPTDGLYYSNPVAPNLAVGSVVIRVTGGPFLALWGDFVLVDPASNLSKSDDLVNIDPSPNCPGSWLCKRHALRFLSRSELEADTQVIIWTDRLGQPSKSPYPESRKVAVDGSAYNEAGRQIGDVHLRLLPLQIVSVKSLALKEPFGWLDLRSEDPTFIGIHFDNNRRDGAALQAYCLKEEPPPPPSDDPGIEIEKRTNSQDADSAPGPTIAVGGQVLWEYIVRNTGNVRLTGIEVSDDDAAVKVTCPATALGAGESMICTAKGTAVGCQYKNVGTVIASQPDGPELTADDASHYFGDQNAKIDVELAVNGQDADDAPGVEVRAGDPLQWSYVVTNTGDVNLAEIKVTDDGGSAPSCPTTSLRPGEKMTCTAGGTAASGQHRRVGAVAAKPPCGDDAKDSDPANYNAGPGPLPPTITIKKYTNGYDADTAPGPHIKVGDAVQWTYIVTNTGGVALSNVKVSDDRGVAVSCPKAALQPAEAMTCTGSGTAKQGQYANIGTVTGKAPNGDTATAADPSHYFGEVIELPCGIKIKKYTNGHDADAAPGPTIPVGDPVLWTYIVSNPGQVKLNNVKVTDDRGVAVSCPKTTLQPGEAMTCTGSGTATAGQYANIGTVVGTPPSGPSATDSDPSHYFGEVPKKPSISIKKYTNGQDADTAPGPEIPVGGAVQWTYVVTNNGEVALSNVKVTDDRGVAVSCPKTSLQPGETMTCTGSGTATQGQYANIGTAVGTPPSGSNVTDSDPSHYFGKLPPPCDISIKKYTNSQDADTAPGPEIPVGGAVHWTYIVTNTGEVTLSNVKVTDDRGVAVSCPKTSLQPAEAMTCTGNGTATAGQYKNVGSVVGTPPSGPNVTDSDPSHYYGKPQQTGGQGCTPGYWKNHTESWPPTGYSPSQKVQSVFGQASGYPSLGNASLLDALSFKGGSSIEGAAGNLLRASVAALLDASHPNVNYPRSPASVIADVSSALASGDRDTMLSLASELDDDNNLGCPLN